MFVIEKQYQSSITASQMINNSSDSEIIPTDSSEYSDEMWDSDDSIFSDSFEEMELDSNSESDTFDPQVDQAPKEKKTEKKKSMIDDDNEIYILVDVRGEVDQIYGAIENLSEILLNHGYNVSQKKIYATRNLATSFKSLKDEGFSFVVCSKFALLTYSNINRRRGQYIPRNLN
jgi:sugar-specific transcriptional regulator TrmB